MGRCAFTVDAPALISPKTASASPAYCKVFFKLLEIIFNFIVVVYEKLWTAVFNAANDANVVADKLLTRRRTLTAPQDNLGISCLPNKDSRQFISNKSESELELSELASIKDIVLSSQGKV